VIEDRTEKYNKDLDIGLISSIVTKDEVEPFKKIKVLIYNLNKKDKIIKITDILYETDKFGYSHHLVFHILENMKYKGIILEFRKHKYILLEK